MTGEERDRERAGVMVRLAWARLIEKAGLVFCDPAPPLFEMMVNLVVDSARAEREVCQIAERANKAIAIEEEREACAKIANDMFFNCKSYWTPETAANEIDRQIRARS